jgi:hypothetical protein
MAHDRPVLRLADDRTELGSLGPRLTLIASVVAVLGLGTAVVLGLSQGDGLRRFGFSYLVSFAFFLSLSLGALFFVAIQHVTRASWSVVVRRLAENIAAVLPLFVVLFVPIVLLAGRIFPWVHGSPEIPAELLAHKRAYLNLPFFIARWALYFTVWGWLGVSLWRRSRRQDQSGDPKLTLGMEKLSAGGIVLFALTVNFASYDLLMSLDPAWFSTMFGPYYWAGGVVGFFALLTLLTFRLQSMGRLSKVIHVEHLHDYGKFLFGFVFFWAYLGFSQYMLIWYANIPEETAWYLRRQEQGWEWFGYILIFGHFLLPFAGLISRYAKRSRHMLAFWAAWILVMHWVDLYWLAMPEYGAATPWPQLMDLACFLGLGGCFVAVHAQLAGRSSLVPTRDPRLKESLAFENA